MGQEYGLWLSICFAILSSVCSRALIASLIISSLADLCLYCMWVIVLCLVPKLCSHIMHLYGFNRLQYRAPYIYTTKKLSINIIYWFLFYIIYFRSLTIHCWKYNYLLCKKNMDIYENKICWFKIIYLIIVGIWKVTWY